MQIRKSDHPFCDNNIFEFMLFPIFVRCSVLFNDRLVNQTSIVQSCRQVGRQAGNDGQTDGQQVRG